MKDNKRHYGRGGYSAGRYGREYKRGTYKRRNFYREKQIIKHKIGKQERGSRRSIGILLLLSILLVAIILVTHRSGVDQNQLVQKLFAGIEKLEEPGAAGFSAGMLNGEREQSDESCLEVHFLDIGQGDATLLKCGEHTMLIDTGEVGKGTAIQSYIMKQGIKQLDYLVLTHPDSDHIGSADVILTKFTVGQVLMPDYEKENSVYRKMMEAMDYKRIQPTIVQAAKVHSAAGGDKAQEGKAADRAEEQQFQPGSSFCLGTAVCTILAPVNVYEDPNNSSIALLVEHGENRFLFTGDAEDKAETDILDYCQMNDISIQANVYKAGHHGSSTSSGDDFLDAVAPQAAVISCGADNEYGHPHEETMKRFRDRGIQVFRTDEQGTVVAVSDGEKLVWK